MVVKFLFNFVLYGLLFFAIFKFFPDTFDTLVDWTSQLYDIVADLTAKAMEKVRESGAGGDQATD